MRAPTNAATLSSRSTSTRSPAGRSRSCCGGRSRSPASWPRGRRPPRRARRADRPPLQGLGAGADRAAGAEHHARRAVRGAPPRRHAGRGGDRRGGGAGEGVCGADAPGFVNGILGAARPEPGAAGPSDRFEGVECAADRPDGVLYVEEEAVPGRADAVARLRSAGIALRFVTNTTTRPRRTDPGAAGAARVRGRARRAGHPGPLALATAGGGARSRGAAHARGGQGGLRGAVEDDGEARRGDRGRPRRSFGYEVLNRAFRLLMDGAELIALQKNRYWRTPDGLSLDAGPFVAALEYATGPRPRSSGSRRPPSSSWRCAISGRAATTPRWSATTSRPTSDGAMRGGARRDPGPTGKYREDSSGSGIGPSATVDSIADVPGAAFARMRLVLQCCSGREPGDVALEVGSWTPLAKHPRRRMSAPVPAKRTSDGVEVELTRLYPPQYF